MSTKIAIVIPVFNERKSIFPLIQSIYAQIDLLDTYEFSLVIVDDGSTDDTLEYLSEKASELRNGDITLLKLRYNVGHQNAILQGIIYASEQPFSNVIVMDGDGEDDPKAIPLLLKNIEYDIIFASRGKRSEGLFFKLFYRLYRLLFKVITGKVMSFGNYSMISKKVALTVAETSFIHYSAFLSRLKYKQHLISFDRAKRIDGESKMNFSSLVHHGFKSLVEYADQTLILLFKLFILIVLGILGVGGIIFYKKFISHEAIIGWTSNMLIGLLNLALTSLGFFILGVFLMNNFTRNKTTTTPKIYEIIKL